MGTIKVKGMSCHHCVTAVTHALEEIEGISRVTADLEKGEASFKETKPVDPELIRRKIQEAGYEVD